MQNLVPRHKKCSKYHTLPQSQKVIFTFKHLPQVVIHISRLTDTRLLTGTTGDYYYPSDKLILVALLFEFSDHIKMHEADNPSKRAAALTIILQ